MRPRALTTSYVAVALSFFACRSFGGEDLPASSQAIQRWQQTHHATLTDSANLTLRSRIAQAIGSVSARSGYSVSEIDAESASAVTTYLDMATTGQAASPPLESLIAAKFLLHASPGPVQPSGLVRVNITYRHPADRLKVNDHLFPAVPVIVSEYGSLKYEGALAGRRVCQGTVTVGAGMDNQVVC